jgi:hypothetical protein
MKNRIIISTNLLILILLISCSTRRKAGNYPIIIKDTRDYSKFLPDSTKEQGYDRTQIAFYWYLISLSEEKRKHRTSFTFSEQEKDKFLNKIDSIKKENDSLR